MGEVETADWESALVAMLDRMVSEGRVPLTLEAEDGWRRDATIDVGAEGLYVDGYRSGSATYWVQADDVLITDVHEALKRVGGTAIAIRADEEAPWELVGKVLFTAQQAGYEDIQLVAVSRASL